MQVPTAPPFADGTTLVKRIVDALRGLICWRKLYRSEDAPAMSLQGNGLNSHLILSEVEGYGPDLGAGEFLQTPQNREPRASRPRIMRATRLFAPHQG